MGAAYDKGMVLYEQRRYSMAAEEFQRELAINPTDGVTLAMLSLTYLQEKNLPVAWEVAMSAIGNAPQYSGGYYAAALISTGYMPPKRRSWLQTRLDLANQPTPWERYVTGKQFISEAIRLDSNEVNHWSALAAIEATRGFWGQCLEAADRGLALRPDDADCARYRGDALLALGRATEAQHTAVTTLTTDPENVTSHVKLGYFALGRGARGDAEDHFREALRVQPTNRSALWGLRQARAARFGPYLVLFRFVFWVSGGMPKLFVATVLACQFVTLYAVDRTHHMTGEPEPRGIWWFVLAEAIAWMILFRPIFTLFLVFDRESRRRIPLGQQIVAIVVGAILFLSLCAWMLWMVDPKYHPQRP
jgi:tetratricopeptide (TPR) repeat protein